MVLTGGTTLTNADFLLVVEDILAKQQDTTLQNRWQDAISFGRGAEAQSFWARDSEDVVNIVWLNEDGLRDITLMPSSGQTIFNFVPLKSIVTFEVREREDIAAQVPLGVGGFLLIRAILPTRSGQLYWVADDEDQAARLKAFLRDVMEAYARSA